MRQDVMETRDTLKDVLLDEEKFALLCISNHDSQGPFVSPTVKAERMKEAALLLQSYERQISTIEGALKVRISIPVSSLPNAFSLSTAFLLCIPKVWLSKKMGRKAETLSNLECSSDGSLITGLN